MANLTKDQVNAILSNAPAGADKTTILDGLVKSGHSLEGVNMQEAKLRVSGMEAQKQMKGNQFETDNRGFFAKARDFTANLVGGKKLAEGAGQALATSDSAFAKGVRGVTSFVQGDGFNTKGVQQTFNETMEQSAIVEQRLIDRIREVREQGGDTTRLIGALEQMQQSATVFNDAQNDFTASLKTDKEVIGSALRLAGTFAGGKIGAGVASKVGGAGTGIVGGAVQGAKIGAGTGAIEGAIQGAGLGLEANKDAGGVAKSALGGATVGAVTGGVLGGAIGAGTGYMKARKEGQDTLKALLEKNPDDSRLAKYQLEKGKLVKDPVASEAVKQGFDEGGVAVMKTAKGPDKKIILEMVDDVEKGMTNRKYAMTNHPSERIAGGTLERIKGIEKLNKQAGKEVGAVAETLRNQPVDIDDAVLDFVDELKGTGVSFKNGQAVFNKADFEGIAPSETLIKRIVKRSSQVDMQDAYEVHKLKQFVNDQLKSAKFEGSQGNIERIVSNFAESLDGKLDDAYPVYNDANTKFRLTREAQKKVTDLFSKKFSSNSPNAQRTLATYLRRLDSEAVSSGRLVDLLDELDQVNLAYGNKFDDDVFTQAIALQEIESVFPTTIRRNALQGQITQGVEKAKGIAGALKRSEGLGDLALEGAGTAIEKAQNVNSEGALKAIRALLEATEEVAQ